MSTDGVVDVDWLVEAPQRKLVFEVDREKAALARGAGDRRWRARSVWP